MLRLKRWIAAILAMMLVINIIQVNISAETAEVISAEENATEVTETPSTEQTTSDITEVVEDIQEEPQNNEGEIDASAEVMVQNYSSNEERRTIEYQNTGDFYNDFESVLNDKGYSSVLSKDENDNVTLTIGDGKGEILALLSQMPQTSNYNYQNWNIKFDFTGELTLPDTFQGLGDWGEKPKQQVPFKGKFTNQLITIKTYKTLFKALDASSDLNGNSIKWEIGTNDATPTIPILTNVLVAVGEKRKINMLLASANRFNPFIGRLIGNAGQVILSELNYSNVVTSPTVLFPENVGLVCNSMADNTNLKIGKVIFSDDTDSNHSNMINFSGVQNVGSLIGNMEDGARLTITEDLTLNATLNGANTGGLVGSMTNAIIEGTTGKTVTVNATLTAEAAGGIAGAGTTTTGSLGANANVVLQSVKANGTQNSGVLYGICTATENYNPLMGVSFGVTRNVSGQGNCGGLFGTLTLSGEGKCTLSAVEGQTLEITTSLTDATNDTSYGGIAGTLTGVRANALIVENCSITSNISVGTETAKYPKYLGGIVGKQVTATVDVKKSTIIVNSPKTANATDRGFGGITANLCDKALLIADRMKIITDSYAANPGGGGVVGSAHKSSIVYLKTSLDLSKCQLFTNATSGQIVGSQDCSLVYAPGVAITRLDATVDGKPVKGMELDDIGNYGEMYRISNFLTVNETTYETSFPKITCTNNEYTLSRPQEYACLALAWQSRGYFPTIDGVDQENWSTSNIKSSMITLNADIDLTGSGIGGLTRDVYSADDTFEGSFNGVGHSLKLDIGAANVANGVTTGDGRIYWHNATGLFAGLSSTATVQDMTLAGSIRLSNNKQAAMYSGALAAQVNGSWTEGSMLSKVSTNVTYDAVVNGGNQLYIGGLIGLISAGTATIDFDTDTSLASNITISHSGNGSANHFGGAIGGIADVASATITCSGATIGGNINSTASINNLYVGGLIGTIWPATGSSRRTINLKNLNVNSFTLSGSASERMGGILGGIWADTDVSIKGLTIASSIDENGNQTPSTTLNANGKAAVGGLVYRASGKWSVGSVDLSGLTINASSASALGLLVCHGEPYTEPINGTKNVGGLYLEMTEHWVWNDDLKKGYNVPSSITFGRGVFDEFVAYIAYRYPDTSYDITHNGSGIISLKTKNDTVNMTDEERNTYVNRTIVGQSKQTNLYSRYYYNLPTVKEACIGGDIDTASELLIWSVYRYAAANLKQYFTFSGVAVNGDAVSNIGGTTENNRANFDMNGLSYYPINITNESITVKYADIKFYNNAIETKEIKNKLTRGTANDHSQHYTMHCALFLNFTAERITETKDYTMTVNRVSFAGTVGVVNGGSGALLCGNVKGESTSGNTATCTVVLADEDASAKAVSLNGLSVAPAGDYTPVLINKFGSYAGLTANYVTTTYRKTQKAGSSLIGDVGGADATHVTVTFCGTIKLPEASSGDHQVFSKATLLNSLQYADGSATYTFESTKDEGEAHDTTHGKELTTSVEYEGKIGFYDDQETTPVASKTGASNFNDYLPYVVFSPATKDEEHTLDNNWHELAVNIHSYNLKNGCGTYGHPYIVTAKEFREAASFVNNGKASNGWEVNMPIGNAEYHNTDDVNDQVVSYTKDNAETIRNHLRSAYYKLVNDETGEFELKNFNGIGSSPNTAFMGVIYSESVTVTLTGGSSAFIKYSYGSVVRDVNFTLQQMPTLTWKDPGRTASNTTIAQQAPSTFFGGVIGCVLGGDNIIDNVSVSGGNKVTGTGYNAHLIPLGGYVGVIAGGGVIFRGNYASVNTNGTGITGTDEQLYRNPIIGRVLGGYAFYEGDGTAPNNGKKDYKINKITPVAEDAKKDLSWDVTSLTVNTAQGLLILSAIVSSGAGSTDSNAYKSGVARNAKYDQIGETADNESTDFALSTSDTPGSVPYLLKQYAGCTKLGDICAKSSDTNGITIKFAKTVFDMDGYGNGYRGLSARYVSNATFSGSTVTPSAVVLRVKSFDGQNATVQNINMDVKEYADDDFHMASMGGIFNIVWTQKQSGGGGAGSNFAQKLTLTNCNVSLKYVNSSGDEVNLADSNTLSDADGRYSVSVGGFIGMANDIEADSESQKTVKHNYLFTNIHIKGTETNTCKIYGPNGVGGLIGATAMASTGVTGYPGILLANRKWTLFGPNFLNCSYSNIEVTGGMAAGGLIGDAYAGGSTTVPGFSTLGISYNNGSFNCYASYTVTEKKLTVGNDSTIKAKAKASIAAGIFGAAGMRVGVNDPEVGNADRTNLPITGTFQTLRLSNVDILVSQENYSGSYSYPDGNIDNAYAGGIIARIGSENSVCFYDIEIQKGSISSKLATGSIVGGIVGSGFTNQTNIMQRCHLSDITVTGVYAGGFLGQGKDLSGSKIFQLHMSDCSIINSTIGSNSTDNGYNKTGYAGGLVGNAVREYYLSNIMIKTTSIVGEKNGRLFGNASNMTVYAAGISVYADPLSTYTIPTTDIGNGSVTTGYIAYADYAGTETRVTNVQSPYVIANPNYTLIGTGNETNPDKMLAGDAVGKITDDSYNSVAARIWADHQTGATDKKNLASYAKASEIINAVGKTTPEVSTFKAVQGYTDVQWTSADLPVLVLKGNDASAIEDYLNVITNGGYGVAKSGGNIIMNNSVSVFYYNKASQSFSSATSDQLNGNPASIYYENGQFHIRSRSFDNTLDRFSLVEAKFTVKVNGVDRTYTVSLPVVVIRELQFDYMATFSYGKEFKADTYNTIKTHLLESTGNPFSLYLTYQYNRENGKYVKYDWQTYMDDGGSMLAIDKVLNFSSSLPTGTQMILVDCQNGNQAYQFTTTADNANNVQFSDFISLVDGTTKFQSSMADILDVTVKANNTSGKFVITMAVDGTVRLNGMYYRLYNADTDVGKDRYDLIVPDLSQSTPSENYYLVITVPNQNNSDYYINGSLSSSLNWSMPSNGTKLHRYLKDGKHGEDKSNNTESTYQISTGYRQTLVSNAESLKIDLNNSQNKMQVKLQDTITFSNQQTYGDSDQLFVKFTANLKEHTGSNPEEKQFPVGTSGIAKFYVQDLETNTYYQWDIINQKWISAGEKTAATSYPWESNGGNMELLLSADGQNALDLAAVRQAIKGAKDTGDSNIIVTAEMDVEFGTPVVLETTVPGSNLNGSDIWVQLHYVGQIATQETALSYSSMRATVDDNAGYYRNVTYQAVLSMDAANIDQLGVNPLQLVNDYQKTIDGKNASLINLNAVLDLSNLQDIESLLSSTDRITFTLSLQRRSGDEYVSVNEASKYIKFDKGWTWSISKDQNGTIVTDGIFDGTRFSFPIEAYVFTDQNDFANYKISLGVTFNTTNPPQVESSDANVIYTYACIKPTFHTFTSGN